MNNPYLEIQLAQQRKEQHRENAARQVSLYLTYETTGTGELIPPQPIQFEVPFFHEPSVTVGHALIRLPDRDYYKLPMVSAGVMRWERNERGFYVGAFIYFRIECDVISEDVIEEGMPVALPIIYHHYVFTASGYKAMSSQINDDVTSEDLPTHRPPAF